MDNNQGLLEDKLTPIQPNERIKRLDILRGIALLGILLVNMAFFSSPIIYTEAAGIERSEHMVDKVVEWGIQFFAEGKFYPMFSFLFGLGFMIFIQRAEQKGLKPVRLYLRRVFILLIIGLIHAFFIWAGDILVVYSLLAFILVLFRNAQPKTLLIWAFILLILPVIMVALLYGMMFLGSMVIDDTQLAAEHSEYLDHLNILISQSFLAYGEGSLADIFSQRATDLGHMYQSAILFFPTVLAMFLFGVYAVKRNIFRTVAEHLPFIKKVWLWSMLIGVPLVFLQSISSQAMDPSHVSISDMSYMLGYLLGGPALCIFYITSFLLITQRDIWIQRLAPVGAVGRMALSNYLFQSIVCTTIFYSYGLGLYGQVGPALGLLLALVIYGVQLILSPLWLKNYSYGPMEWVWRRLTYSR
jgi:uncharacterized protein